MESFMSGNPVIVLDECDMYVFENKSRKLIEMGYVLSSSSVGFINAEEYSFGEKYQAVFVKTETVQGSPIINSTTNIETNTAPINIDNRD